MLFRSTSPYHLAAMMHVAAGIVALLLSLAPAPAVDVSTADRDARAAIRRLVVKAASGQQADAHVDGSARAAVDRWIEANRASIRGVGPGPLTAQPWGHCTYRRAAGDKPATLYLHVFDWHASGKLAVYGLAGGVARAFLLADPAAMPLPVTPTGRDLIISVPKRMPDAIDTVVALELDGEPKVTPLSVKPGGDGKIVLHARDAIVYGRTLRYEPEPHKNTLGYWTDAADWAKWELEIPAPGRYAVEILQGCGKGHGGSIVEFRAAGQALPVIVQDTGHFQNFVTRHIGEVTFDRPGRHTLEVRPTKKAGVAVMDLRQVTLTPTAGR